MLSLLVSFFSLTDALTSTAAADGCIQCGINSTIVTGTMHGMRFQRNKGDCLRDELTTLILNDGRFP
jgi:hypothetical protein